MIGLMLMMSLIKLPKLRDYWSDRLFLIEAPFASIMSRERFTAIQACLQVVDRSREQELKSDPSFEGLGAYWKIARMMTAWKTRITSMISGGQYYTLDETGTGFERHVKGPHA